MTANRATVILAPLRKQIDDNELVILAQVASAHRNGWIIECGKEERAHEILVEDGYLTREILPGMARSYARFRLTEMGRAALALKSAHGLTNEERQRRKDRIEDGEWPPA